MKIKKTIQRMRYKCSWKYPTLYAWAGKLAFPFQLAVLGLALFAAVDFYQDHYSWAAATKTNQFEAKPALIKTALAKSQTKPLETKTEPTVPAKVAAKPTVKPNLEISASSKESELEEYMNLKAAMTANHGAKAKPEESKQPVANQLIKVKSSAATADKTPAATNTITPATILNTQQKLQAELSKAEQVLASKKQQTKQLEKKIKDAKALLKTQATERPNKSDNFTAGFDSLKVATGGFLDDKWLKTQASSQFVIQLASSSDYNALVRYVKELPVIPVAIYPYKISQQGAVVYGVSTGLYPSSEQALQGIAKLSKKAKINSPWVRNIGDVKAQILSLN